MKTLGYCRISTEKQTEGASLENQRDRITRWCAANGYTLDSIEEDIQSGSTTERPGFQTAIRSVLEGGEGSIIIFYKIDRFSRNMLDSLETFKMLVNYKIRVVFLEEGIDSSSSMGPFMMNMILTMFSIMAEWEREQILGRTAAGREFAKANSRKYSKNSRYGLTQTADSKTVIQNADETAAIWRARELHDKGLSYQAIGNQLLHEGYRPRSGKHWSTSVVYCLVNGYKKRHRIVTSDRLEVAAARYLDNYAKSS